MRILILWFSLLCLSLSPISAYAQKTVTFQEIKAACIIQKKFVFAFNNSLYRINNEDGTAITYFPKNDVIQVSRDTSWVDIQPGTTILDTALPKNWKRNVGYNTTYKNLRSFAKLLKRKGKKQQFDGICSVGLRVMSKMVLIGIEVQENKKMWENYLGITIPEGTVSLVFYSAKYEKSTRISFLSTDGYIRCNPIAPSIEAGENICSRLADCLNRVRAYYGMP